MWMIPNAYFPLLAHTETFLVIFYDPTAETGVSFRTHGQNGTDGRTDRQTDVKVEIVI